MSERSLKPDANLSSKSFVDFIGVDVMELQRSERSKNENKDVYHKSKPKSLVKVEDTNTQPI